MPASKINKSASASASASVKYLPSQGNCGTDSASDAKKPKQLTRIGNFFKGTDGWDELGSGLGQTLPGVGEHIATMSMLGILTPAVWLGVKGMASEMDENHQILDKLKETREGLLKELKKLFGAGFNIAINQKGIRGVGDILKLLSENESDPNTFNEKIKALTEYYNNHTDLKIQKMAYHAAPLGLAAMTGMTAGMVTATARSVAEMRSTTGAEMAAHGLEIATAGLFIPAQAAMVGYGIYKAKEGIVKNNEWTDKQKALDLIDPNNIHVSAYRTNEEKSTVNSNPHKYISIPDITSDAGKEMFSATQDYISIPDITSDAGKEMFSATQDYIKKRQKYNNMGKTIYGTGMAISEMGMMAGSITALTPAAAIAPAIMIPSAAATIGFAGLRIYAQDKEGKFTGNAHNHIHDGDVKQAWKNAAQQEGRKIANLFRAKDKQKPIEEYTGTGTDCGHNHSKLYIDNPKQLAGDFTHTTQELATAKLKSLALYAKKHHKSVADFEKMVKTGKKSWLLGTTLQSDVLKSMQVIYQANKYFFQGMLTIAAAPVSTEAPGEEAAAAPIATEAAAASDPVLTAIKNETDSLGVIVKKDIEKYFDIILLETKVESSVASSSNNVLLIGTQATDKEKIIGKILQNPILKQTMAKIYIDYEHHVEKETVKRSYGNIFNIKHENTNIFAQEFDVNTRDTILNTMLDNVNIMQKLSEFIIKDYKNKQKQDRTHVMDNLIFLAQQVQMKNRQSSKNASMKINPMP